MSEATTTHGDNTAGNSERNTPIPSRAHTPSGGDSNQPLGKRARFKRKLGKGVDKFKRFFGTEAKGEGTGQEVGSSGEGTAANISVAAAGASAGLDIHGRQVETQALSQAGPLDACHA